MSDSDVREIQHLIYTAAYMFDSGDLEGFSGLFETATMDLGGLAPVATGSEGVRKFIRDYVILHKGSPRTKHQLSNIIIEVNESEDRASAQSYVVVLQGVDRELRPILAGRYVDAFIKRDNRWTFESRLGADGLVGDLSQHLRRQPSVESEA